MYGLTAQWLFDRELGRNFLLERASTDPAESHHCFVVTSEHDMMTDSLCHNAQVSGFSTDRADL